ncbi:short chain oxidoreductase/dehydrogenase [Apiospora marii]|uniref:Short chain oxidoreductase/dehydrogenase n=1 Tax=Apiospora marii TaxID=335849 RepID=A0ABR1RJ00_9PEZI
MTVSSTNPSKVWLITGASRGLGFELAKAALTAGHTVIACRRSHASKDASSEEVTKLGGTWVQIDVGSDTLESELAAVIKQHGKVDVLVNNAAHGLAGTVEDCSIEEINRIFRVNALGPIRTAKVVIPSMRAQGSGTIVNISSSTGINALPGVGMYSATKHALEGTSEALQAELAPFGIRVLVVEPGAMATRFTDTSLENCAVNTPLSDCYKGTYAEKVLDYMMDVPSYMAKAGSPEKAALRIVEAVDGSGMLEGKELGLRLPLGKDVLQDVASKGKQLTELSASLKDVIESIA